MLAGGRTESGVRRGEVIAAGAKQEHWHRINLLRGRVQVTAVVVVILALLALASLFVPGFVDIEWKTVISEQLFLSHLKRSEKDGTRKKKEPEQS